MNSIKNEIRQKIKKLLKEKSDIFEKENKKITQKIINSSEFIHSTKILAYCNLPDEVNLENVIDFSLQQKKQVFIPKINDDFSMEFYEYSADLKKGKYGISEPNIISKEKLFILNKIQNNEEILVLVPGRAFSLNGKRIGRGKGFYDKYLCELINSIKKSQKKVKIHITGVCFSVQILNDLPSENYDFLMDKIFSC